MRKVDVEVLVAKHLPRLVKVMNLQDRDIHVEILHSVSKESDHMPDTIAYVDDCDTSHPNIVIHYDAVSSPSSAYATLVHELLHIKLQEIAPKKPSPQYDAKEEQVVRDIEALILSLVKRKKL